MITLSRALTRRLRSVLRRSVVEQEPRGEWPLLLCRAGPQGLLLQAQRGAVGLCLHQPGPQPTAALAFRSDRLAAFEGRADEPVTFEQAGANQWTARWSEAGAARELDLEAVDPEAVQPLRPPTNWASQPASFAAALAEAAATTAQGSARYALGRVQLRGRAGQVVATDGRQLLVRGGYRLPWQEDLLVPRLPALGLRELRACGPAEVGRTEAHVWLRLGPWAFGLKVDCDSRFPDHQRVVPSTKSGGCRLRLDPEDARLLDRELARLPGSGDEPCPVTLELGDPVVVRAGSDCEPAVEVVLPRSRAEGPPLRLSLNRLHLRRALRLGFLECHVGGRDLPVLWRDGPHLYLFVPLNPDAGATPGPGSANQDHPENEPGASPVPERRSVEPMPELNPNGHPAGDPGGGIEDLIVEAEDLRRVLQEAAARAARLAAALKQQRRQGRAVQAALVALRQLQPGAPLRRPSAVTPSP